MKNRILKGFIIVLYVVVGFCFVGCFDENNVKTTQKPQSDDYVEFFDVGQGDCALISSNGHTCLIDTGTSTSDTKIKEALKNKKINNIDLISISHFHNDHTGGLYEIVKAFSVDNLLFPIEGKESNVSNDVVLAKTECLAEDGEFVVAKQGQTVNLGDFKLSVLYQNVYSNDENDRSVYVMAKIGDIKFFFTGDGEGESENLLLNSKLNLDCDVLKIPHHGGSKSSSYGFLKSCSPEYAVISCGKDNMYGHPHEETLSRLKSMKIKTYRTDKNGNIIFDIIDEKLSVTTDK